MALLLILTGQKYGISSITMDSNSNITDAHHPLLHDTRRGSNSSNEHQFSTLADQLGIEEVDALHNFSNSRSIGSATSRTMKKYDNPTVILTQEQVETLIQTLEDTSNALKQLTYMGNELKPRRRPRVPRCIVSNLFLITAVWQITGIVALTILRSFTQHIKKERSTFIWTVAILVFFQSFNLLLVFITSVKLTKQFMHHTVTKSFLGQSFLSMTLLFAGLYTLVYHIKPDSFEGAHSEAGLKISDDIFSSVLVFANMLYFSVSTATLCGAGHVIASSWYAQLMSSIQMLMSYVYFASVLSIAVHPPNNITYKMKRGKNVNTRKTYGTIQNV